MNIPHKWNAANRYCWCRLLLYYSRRLRVILRSFLQKARRKHCFLGTSRGFQSSKSCEPIWSEQTNAFIQRGRSALASCGKFWHWRNADNSLYTFVMDDKSWVPHRDRENCPPCRPRHDRDRENCPLAKQRWIMSGFPDTQSLYSGIQALEGREVRDIVTESNEVVPEVDIFVIPSRLWPTGETRCSRSTCGLVLQFHLGWEFPVLPSRCGWQGDFLPNLPGVFAIDVPCGGVVVGNQ